MQFCGICPDIRKLFQVSTGTISGNNPLRNEKFDKDKLVTTYWIRNK